MNRQERHFIHEKNKGIERRIYGLAALIGMALVGLLLYAFQLQVIMGEHYLGLSDGNRIRTVEMPPARGLIYDRNGTLLVNNVPSFNLYVNPADIAVPAAPAGPGLADTETVFRRLAGLLEMDGVRLLRPDEMVRRMASIRGQGAVDDAPVKIKGNLSMREVARIEAHLFDLPGVTIQVEFKRNAVYEALAGHLIGYVGEISQAHLDTGRYPGVKRGGVVGQYGVEQTYDAMIRGTPGQKWVEVNALGHEIRVMNVKAPLPGKDTFLTLDLAVQKAAEEALGEAAGAIVALDPHTGEVLALVSHPAFNPNDLSAGISTETWKNLISDKNHPLTNRAIQGQYPPGSTFKVVMAAAILETQTATPSQEVSCPGFFPFGNRDFRDWKEGGHGSVSLYRALVESCDVYFYRMGDRLGIGAIERFSGFFGLGKPTGIDLPSEKGGLIPSVEWKRRVRKEPWYAGETISVSIGQGPVLVTPLQMAATIGAVGSDGVWHTPQIVKKMRDHRTGEITTPPILEGRRLPISGETLKVIQEALSGVVADGRGTATSARSSVVSIAGKTGTAQVVVLKKGPRKKLPKEFDDHAWFVAYAPAEHPRIAVVVLIEHGGHGGSAAAPLAKKVIESYFGPADSSPIDGVLHTPASVPPQRM